MAPDDQAFEILILRHQLLILRHQHKRGPPITHSEKFILITLLEQLQRIQKASLEQWVLIYQPETLLRWHRELVKKKWTFDRTPKSSGLQSIRRSCN